MSKIETFALIDPATVMIGTNIRTSNAAPSAELVESVRALGVITPVTVEAGETEGTWLLRHGQRRVLAALEAEQKTIPAVIVTADGDPVARLVDQWAENEHRDQMTDPDRVEAVQQLALLGVSAADIARKTGLKRDVVDAARAVATSECALDAVGATSLTIEQAAVLTEFEDDPEAVEALLLAHEDAYFDQAAEELRQARALREAVVKMQADLTADGVTVSMVQPGYGADAEVKALSDLCESTEQRQALDAEAHAATCPGHAVAVITEYDREARMSVPKPVQVCVQWATHGHTYRYAYISTPAQAAGPMSEEQKAERRRVIANNKAWDAATAVRARWIAAFAKARGAVPDGEAFLARAILGRDAFHTQGWSSEWSTMTSKVTDRTTTKVLTRTAVAGLLSEWHKATGRMTWRRPTDCDARYMRALIAWGYQPSPVEKLLLGEGEPAAEPEVTEDAAHVEVDEDDAADVA